MFKFKIFHRRIFKHRQHTDSHTHVFCSTVIVMFLSHLFHSQYFVCVPIFLARIRLPPSFPFFVLLCHYRRIVICIRVRWVVWGAKRNMLHVYFRCVSVIIYVRTSLFCAVFSLAVRKRERVARYINGICRMEWFEHTPLDKCEMFMNSALLVALYLALCTGPVL